MDFNLLYIIIYTICTVGLYRVVGDFNLLYIIIYNICTVGLYRGSWGL